ncbi:hypothetical protein V2J09_017594 [Rumex salicifolius]
MTFQKGASSKSKDKKRVKNVVKSWGNVAMAIFWGFARPNLMVTEASRISFKDLHRLQQRSGERRIRVLQQQSAGGDYDYSYTYDFYRRHEDIPSPGIGH